MPGLTGLTGSSLPVKLHSVRYFRGIDLANPPEKAEKERSCGGINMIRDVPGKVRKRTGYERVGRYPGRINGLFLFDGRLLIHAGGKLFAGEEEIADGLADRRSDAKLLQGYLWLMDGSRLFRYDGNALIPADSIAYLPTITVSRAPEGGGTPYEPINLLGKYCRESFLGTAGAAVYQLSLPGLSADAVRARKRDAAGNWTELAEGGDFSVDRGAGRVTFTAAPGIPPVAGEDNVEIEYARENGENRNRINRCRFGICYGLSGAPDRLFVSGNPDEPNRDYHSALLDPTYFGDEWYGVIGQEHSPVMGYSIINGQLAAHKKNDDNGRNIFLREGSVREDGTGKKGEGLTTQFRVTGVIQGAGAAASFAFGFAGEPIFLSAAGIAAAAPYEFNSERYVQNRGFYINRALLSEPDLSEASAAVYRDFYMLAVPGGRVYILDTLETAARPDEKSSRQYEAYLWDNVPARVMANIGERLYFGTENGSVMRFYEDAERPESYSDADDGEGEAKAIAARWDFDFSGTAFYRQKHLRYLAVRLAPYAGTSVTVTAETRDETRKLFGGSLRLFLFSRLGFSRFRFSSTGTLQTAGGRIRLKNTDAVRFSLRNEEINEPFGLHEIAVEYSEGKHYLR